VRASYIVDGCRGELFFADVGSRAAAADALASLRVHQERWGAIVGDVTGENFRGFRSTGAGLGSATVARIGARVAGVYRDTPFSAQNALLIDLARNLTSERTAP